MKEIRRLLITTTWLQAFLLGLLATGMATGFWSWAPTTFAALEWSPFDAWARTRPAGATTSPVVLVQRDAASDARFGAGPWDRAMLARLVTILHDADAAVIGLYVSTREPSPPHLGGAASDALLGEATANAGNVVYPLAAQLTADGRVAILDRLEAAADLTHPSWPPIGPALARPWLEIDERQGALPPPAQQALAVGHTLVIPDADHVFRRAPLFAAAGDRAIPAFALALHRAYSATLSDARSATARGDATVLLTYAGDGAPSAFQSLSFAAVWDAVEAGQQDVLQGWVKDKIVLLLPDPTAAPMRQTSLGKELPEGILQTHMLNAMFSKQRPRTLDTPWRGVIPIALSGVLAWILLNASGWRGIGAGAGLIAAYGLSVLAALPLAGLILPAVIPLTAAVLGLLIAVAWTHVLAGERERALERDMLTLQQDLVAVREALVCRENAVEALEEDRDNARAAADVSAVTLGTQVEDARAQEAAARRRVEELERELDGMRVAASEGGHLDDASLERLRQECESMGIITRDAHTLALFRDLKKGARSTLPVLLLGEPGTGKELFARAAHRLSTRSAKPFIAVNMAAVSPELFESELFGHARGSFTGAVSDRRGYFELAQGGTIFLDEIGDLRLDHQAKLLRVLQDKTFYRVGATTPTTVDVRIITATNKDVQRGVSEGWFREDLYFRLKGLVLQLPALRARPQDIPAIAEHCLRELAAQAGRKPLELSQDAMTALQSSRWRGNIRELRHCLEQAMALAERPILTRADLRLEGRDAAEDRASDGAAILPDQAGDAAVLQCLRHHRFDMQATARALNWDRSTVTQRLKGLCFQALADASGDRDKAAQELAGEPTLVRSVELKLMDYYGHLLKTIQTFPSADEAIAGCRRRFKNLPDRHFRAAERLIRNYFAHRPESSHTSSPLPNGERVGERKG